MSMTKQERDELLQVATQLAAGMNASNFQSADQGWCSPFDLNSDAVRVAKDLIEKVNAECGL